MPERGVGTSYGQAVEGPYRGVVPGWGFPGCVRGFRVDQEIDQEARPEKLAFTKAAPGRLEYLGTQGWSLRVGQEKPLVGRGSGSGAS